MIRIPDFTWEQFLTTSLKKMILSNGIDFLKITPASILAIGGVYLICQKETKDEEIPMYIGVSGNLRQRIYNNHLMGDLIASSFKKYLIKNKICKTIGEAKSFMKQKCTICFILEKEIRKRGALENYLSSLIFPKFGFESEH